MQTRLSRQPSQTSEIAPSPIWCSNASPISFNVVSPHVMWWKKRCSIGNDEDTPEKPRAKGSESDAVPDTHFSGRRVLVEFI